jgi:threonyl-tRNA synthetase
MNCLSHMIIYKRKIMSYRDLPQRYFELGVVHRHEKSGVLHGLMRVRTFTQDDAHLICRPDQVESEILDLIKFYQDIYALFDYEFDVELSTRPEKSIGSDADWELATEGLRQALDKSGMPYAINEGDGAFYGPKIDFHLRDSIGRSWQCGTIQVDFTLPERFDIVYVGEDGERHRPVMIHRAMLGSIERFIGVLTEHCAGAYPVWLAPVQARLLNVTDAQADFMKKAEAFLVSQGIRVESDSRNEKLGYKIREAQVEKIPYMLVIGDKEVEAGCVNIRSRDGEDPGMVTLEEAARLIKEAATAPFKAGGMSYSFSG